MGVAVTELNAGLQIEDRAAEALVLLPASIERTSDGEQYIVYAASTTSVLKLLKSKSIPARLGGAKTGKIAYQENRGSEWFGPTILITSALLSQNPSAVSVAINVISSYVYDIFKGKADDPTAKCTFAYVGKAGRKRLYYEGPTSGLSEIQKIIEGLENGPDHV